eukprot:TRINITY_DN601_c0_g4_i1.p1 TRINITY_DN601_c0_g4~~TRINITY_DN601_c0_g4_i1.p1  ORF type:complete len:528 (+),score=196.20 TRINITY_DN601_c0_g4_i1:131-1714(+)
MGYYSNRKQRKMENLKDFTPLATERYDNLNNIVASLNFADTTPDDATPAYLVDDAVLATPSANLQALLAIQDFKTDLTAAGQIWTYGNPDATKRSLIVYQKFNFDNVEETRANTSKIGTNIVREAAGKKVQHLAVVLPDSFDARALGGLILSLNLSNYKFERKEKASFNAVTKITIVGKAKLDSYSEFLVRTTQYTLFARELVNERANIANPTFMLEICQRIAKANPKIKLNYIQGEDLVKNGLNLIYGVGRGSRTPPVMVTMSYEGNPENPNDVVALIGKGVCFDSGGLNIKTQMMELMYFDKGGACATIGAFRGAVESGLKINLVLGVAFVENFLGDNAYRPSDILKSYKGITVEIGNTDAEGRLILADTMSWTQKHFKPNTLIDVATLTGACIVALGYDTAGIFGNDDSLVGEITQAGALVSEPFWRLPINNEFRNAMKAEAADLNNLSKQTMWGGACTAAAFLENFVEAGVKWAHLDIAGAIYSAADKPNRPRGANGFSASTLLNYLWRRSNNSANQLKSFSS